MNYFDVGVDLDKAHNWVDTLKQKCKKTFDSNVISGIGGFCSLYRNPQLPSQIIVSSTNSVGSKLLFNYRNDALDLIGFDLVAMVINDIITSGADPVFFLDYFASHQFNEEQVNDIIKGIITGCRIAEIALIGGKTAEMPVVYKPGEFDLAGFGVGLVSEENLINCERVSKTDVIIGIESSGPHSTGFALINEIFKEPDSHIIDLAVPTLIYTRVVKSIRKYICAAVHIAGNGLEYNIRRVIPNYLNFKINWGSWKVKDIFKVIQERGNIPEEEMRRVFNMGIGFAVIVRKEDVEAVMSIIETFYLNAEIIGEIN